MRLTVEERVFILESYLKTMSYAHCRQSFFEKFRRQAPVKSAIAKMIKKFRETGSLLDKNRNRQKSVLTPGNCRWFKNLIRGNIGVLDQVFFTDEAWFHLSGYVNSQNYQTWRTEKPPNYTETTLHPQKNRRVVCHFEALNNWTFVF